MTVPGVAAGLLLAAGLALGILLVLLALQARALRRSRPASSPPPPPEDDDLPGFLAAPPGSDGHPAAPRAGWVALSPVAEPTTAPSPPPSRPFRAGRPALIAGTATLLLLAAAVVVMATASPRRPEPAAGPGTSRSPATHPATGVRTGIRADLVFAGVVLERRAVGVTAAYPHVRISAGNGPAVASVELVTFNCLADAAPRDPMAAGCSRVVPQYADLTSPALQVTRSADGGLVVSGRFPTYVRPNGTPPARTGAVYELRIEVTPRTPVQPGTDAPVTGFLQLGDDRAPTTPLSVVRPGS